MPKILKLVDVSRHLGVPVRTLYDWIGKERFVAPIAGTKPPRWNLEDVEAWRASANHARTVDAAE